jgi:hypothetical protein
MYQCSHREKYDVSALFSFTCLLYTKTRLDLLQVVVVVVDVVLRCQTDETSQKTFSLLLLFHAHACHMPIPR